MRDVLIVIGILVVLGSVVLAVYSFDRQRQLGKSLEEERYSRMVAEESSQKSAAKLATLDNQLKSAEEKIAKVKAVLDQEKGVNAELKKQYESLMQNKSELEARLQATVQEPSPEPAESQENAMQENAATPVGAQ
jgi:FtsZ-interacting cell division protein ZipA